MKLAKCVVVGERDCNHRGLERLSDGSYKLKEIKGEIFFSESKDSCLNLRIKGYTADIWWQNQRNSPMQALVGQTIRGFYESRSDYIINLDAYKLLNDKNEVLTRGTSSRKYVFVGED